MKKLLAVVMAAAIVLSLGVVAFAEKADPLYTPKEIYVTMEKAIFDGAKAGSDNEVEPDSDLYFYIPNAIFAADAGEDDAPIAVFSDDFTNKDLYKVKFDKGDDNTKMISKMSLSEKNFDGDRGPWLKVEVKPDFTDTEYKISPSVTFTLKEDQIVAKGTGDDADTIAKAGTKFIYEVGKYYISNTVEDADRDYSAGDGGVVLKPAKNDDNEITWEDENNTIATLKFMGDDNQTKFFPKLSTKWEDADYAEYFADQNAYIFNFVASTAGKTKISSTSRATLELYNPYYDEDEGEYTVDPENCIVYQVQDDGSMVEAAFKVVENEDGDMVFQTKTRELGIYIIAEKPYTTAAAEDVETPNDGKAIPDTGIWA